MAVMELDRRAGVRSVVEASIGARDTTRDVNMVVWMEDWGRFGGINIDGSRKKTQRVSGLFLYARTHPAVGIPV